MTHLQGNDRARYVQEMFGDIAERYDVMNRLMTFGQDQSWRRLVIRQANVPPGGSLIDVATGTGDIAFEAVRQVEDVQVVGADFAYPMMRVGRERKLGRQIEWVEADAIALPFPDAAFDAAVSGYLMRNVIDIHAAFREQMRVVKPGGRVVCLDTSPPPNNILKPFILAHFRFVIPTMGRLVAGSSSAYEYLPESTEGFKTPDELADMMREVGLVDVSYKRLMLGTMAVHVGTRPV